MTTTYDAQELIDLSIQTDSTATAYPATQEEFDELFGELLAECDDDCEPEYRSGAGYSGPDARGSVVLWGIAEERGPWKVELVNAPR